MAWKQQFPPLFLWFLNLCEIHCQVGYYVPYGPVLTTVINAASSSSSSTHSRSPGSLRSSSMLSTNSGLARFYCPSLCSQIAVFKAWRASDAASTAASTSGMAPTAACGSNAGRMPVCLQHATMVSQVTPSHAQLSNCIAVSKSIANGSSSPFSSQSKDCINVNQQ